MLEGIPLYPIPTLLSVACPEEVCRRRPQNLREIPDPGGESHTNSNTSTRWQPDFPAHSSLLTATSVGLPFIPPSREAGHREAAGKQPNTCVPDITAARGKRDPSAAPVTCRVQLLDSGRLEEDPLKKNVRAQAPIAPFPSPPFPPTPRIFFSSLALSVSG